MLIMQVYKLCNNANCAYHANYANCADCAKWAIYANCANYADYAKYAYLANHASNANCAFHAIPSKKTILAKFQAIPAKFQSNPPI